MVFRKVVSEKGDLFHLGEVSYISRDEAMLLVHKAINEECCTIVDSDSLIIAKEQYLIDYKNDSFITTITVFG
jgi:hypothetical protein